MAGSLMMASGPAQEYEGRVTVFVALACLLAALGGGLFGYDIGISGGVTSMDDFLKKFFPVVYSKKNYQSSHDEHYCKYDNQKLAAFTSSLYIAGLVATFGASYTTRTYGRRSTILIAGASFLVGAALNAGALNISMLILGRVMLGVGVGFGNQAVPLYLAEMAPPRWRGGLNMLFQLATTVGIFCANLVNYGTQHIRLWGWRLSLGLAAVPALVMLAGGLFLFETPNSLIEHRHLEKGKDVLIKIRGTQNIQAEFDDLMEASKVAQSVNYPFTNLFQKRNRPQMVMAFCLPIFQILTGINSILFYAPLIFQALGFGKNASLYSSVFTGAVMVVGSIVTILTLMKIAVPLYLAEMAPPRWRGGLNMLFQLATTVGIFCANLVNYGTQHIRLWGWRLSLGLAAVPALVMLAGGLFLFETPNSLIEHRHLEKGKDVLIKIRGTQNIQAEFDDLMEASKVAQSVNYPFTNLFQKRNRPQMVMAFCLPIFQILTGINSILFYAPLIFQALGFGKNASLYSSVFTGAVMVVGSIVTILTVDRFGRRVLLITGGSMMVTCQVIIAVILAKFYAGDKILSKELSAAVTLLICLFVLGFAISWGGLGWVVPSEIFPLEIRSAGQSVVVSVNLFFTFAIAQAFLSMLCGLKYGIFLFFAFWEAVMTLYVYFLLPETKDVPLEEMVYVWRAHWFWGKFLVTQDVENLGKDSMPGCK